ncbi:MAG: acyltransferase family protein [Bryobacteraceae bacterium]
MEPKSTGRLVSLDVFRGFTIASMILVNNPGSSPAYAQLEHAVWHGWTFTDTVFPFFLWIVGVAMTLSTARRMERGQSRADLLRHAFQRAVILFLIGVFVMALPDIDLATIRIPGVLQRIAVCYLIAFLIFLHTGVRGQILWLLGFNAAYLALMWFYPTPGCGAGSWSMDCNFARYFDSLFLKGHMWRHTRDWDPEGIVSTLPAISTVLFGALAGHVLRHFSWHGARLQAFLFGGSALVAAGQVMSIWIPINKNLWTPSFAFFMAGLAMLAFALWYWLVEVRGLGRWFRFFEIYGSNAILVYVLSDVLATAAYRTGLHEWWYENVCRALAAEPKNASLLYALTNVGVLWLVAWALWRRRWFVRI